MTHGRFLGSSGWRLTMLLEDLALIYDISLISQPLGTKDWVHLCGQWFNWPCLPNEASIKTLGTKAWETFLVGECIDMPGVWCTLISWEEIMKFCIQYPPRASHMCPYIWLVLICILDNKTVIINVVLYRVLLVFLENYWIFLGGLLGCVVDWSDM